ncbi:MAG: hypothetical protein AAGA30_09790, partial [Planctomycetota bacterium]
MNLPHLNRGFLFSTITFVALSSAPVYHFGRPWVQHHQQNVIAYDCKLIANSIPIGAKYPGRIAKSHFEIGQFVDIGDILVEMDSREIDTEIQRAGAVLNSAKARLSAERVAIEKSLATMTAEQECLELKAKVTQSRAEALETETQ